jgi:hypothetical protein
MEKIDMKRFERLPEKFQNIKYFFSLALEDYFGDIDELMKMADIDNEDLENFFSDTPEKYIDF